MAFCAKKNYGIETFRISHERKAIMHFFLNLRLLYDPFNRIRDLLDISKITVKRWVDEGSGNIKFNKRRGRPKKFLFI